MTFAPDPPAPPGTRGGRAEGLPLARLRLFGPTSLVGNDGCEIHEVLRRPKVRGVLSYLAAAQPEGFHERDELLALFWPKLDDFRARRSLRKVLHLLRRAIGPGTILSRGRNQVSVDRKVLWCDVPALREALERGDRKEALDLYRGELLPAFHLPELREFGEWIDGTRRELKALVARAGWELAEDAARQTDLEGAVAWGRRAFSCASAYDEEALRRFVALLDECGRRAEALQVYDAFASRLERDLGVAPAPDTRALLAVVRAR
jgi:DNA-binding SARP family transcriptional activator